MNFIFYKSISRVYFTISPETANSEYMVPSSSIQEIVCQRMLPLHLDFWELQVTDKLFLCYNHNDGSLFPFLIRLKA